MKIVKGSNSQKLLALLEGGAAFTINMIWAMSADKGTSRKRLSFLRDNFNQSPGKQIINDWKIGREEYKHYHQSLSRLEKQGLIESRDALADGCKSWVITRGGLSALRSRENNIKELSVPGRATIISYDIPEKMRRERNKLRETLKLIGFKQVHQSVWFGNKKVTRQFLELLRERQVFKYVHIFEINKTGTLERVE